MLNLLSSLFRPEFLPYEKFNPQNHKRGFVYSRSYAILPENVTIPTKKYPELYQAIKNHPELSKLPVFAVEKPVEPADLEKVHTPEYLRDLLNLEVSTSLERSEIYLTEEILEFFLYGTMGTVRAAEMAYASQGIFMNLAGGFHHAFSDHAEGFCLVNDVALAIEKLLEKEKLSILVLDLDVHQGNGIVHYFQNRPEVFVCNIHQSDNYPIKQKGDLDIGLPGGTDGKEYLKALEKAIETINKKFKPNFLFYVAGVDPYEKDLLGGFCLTKEDMRQREKLVKEALNSWKIPCVVVLAGGYAPSLKDIIFLHLQTAEILLL